MARHWSDCSRGDYIVYMQIVLLPPESLQPVVLQKRVYCATSNFCYLCDNNIQISHVFMRESPLDNIEPWAAEVYHKERWPRGDDICVVKMEIKYGSMQYSLSFRSERKGDNNQDLQIRHEQRRVKKKKMVKNKSKAFMKWTYGWIWAYFLGAMLAELFLGWGATDCVLSVLCRLLANGATKPCGRWQRHARSVLSAR